jgi:hypothetical protein
MTTNTNTAAAPTAHGACSHPVTKAARAKCRKERGAAYNTSLAARRTRNTTNQVIEACTCKNAPATDNVCDLCDRPTNVLHFAA